MSPACWCGKCCGPTSSIAYNASYMVPEIILTGLAAALSYGPLERYYQGKDLM